MMKEEKELFGGKLQCQEGYGITGITVKLSVRDLRVLQDCGFWCANNNAPSDLTNFLRNITSVLREEGDGILFADHTCE